MPTSEGGLVSSMMKAIAKTYPEAWIFKTVGNPFQMSGVPDLLVCVNGRLVGIEAKFARPGESHYHAAQRTTAGQDVQLMRINRAGGTAGVAVTVGEALALIEKALNDT